MSATARVSHVGLEIVLATEFRSEKIPRNRLGTVSVIPRKKCSFRVIPRFTEESIPRLGTEENGMKQLVLQKILLSLELSGLKI
jgi:hypothetical protein